jgi:quinoprotein glucose dehydrogenase
MRLLATAICVITATSSVLGAEMSGNAGDWGWYGGDAGGSRYSPLDQINKTNVGQLKPAWELHVGDVSDGSNGRPKSEFEATPIVVAGTMYLSTPFNRVLAVDPETEKEKWTFDPKIDLRQRYGKDLWKARLPAGGQASPMTYLAGNNRKQFVVIAAGGHGKLGTSLGDSLIAYSLP